MDMEASLREIYRVLKPGSSGLIVVQSSYFKEHEIELGDIYVEMCDQLGFTSNISFREKVKIHMAHVNTKSSVYVKNKIYHEDVVCIKKPL
jgi:ubiquinone/menaquinone biosynthesis C-methylase UbiE